MAAISATPASSTTWPPTESRLCRRRHRVFRSVAGPLPRGPRRRRGAHRAGPAELVHEQRGHPHPSPPHHQLGHGPGWPARLKAQRWPGRRSRWAGRMILVTGATGNVGRNVVSQLIAAGQDVRAVTRDPATARFPEGIDVVTGDFRQPQTLAAALDGVKQAFLFPLHGHLAPFLDSEHVVARTGLPWTFVRPGAFMANDLRWAPQIKAVGAVHAPYPDAATAPVDERDIAAVVVAALLGDGHAGHAYTLTGPESLTQVERVQFLAEALGRPVRFAEQTPENFRRTSGLPPHVADGLLSLLAARVGTTAEVTGTVQAIAGRPPHSYRQWAARHVAEF